MKTEKVISEAREARRFEMVVAWVERAGQRDSYQMSRDYLSATMVLAVGSLETVWCKISRVTTRSR